MKKDIEMCKEIGVEGVVFGILTKDNKIDMERTLELIKLSGPLKVAFHMAFDEVEDSIAALDQLIILGVDRVLTKGGKFKSAHEGREMLKKLKPEVGAASHHLSRRRCH